MQRVRLQLQLGLVIVAGCIVSLLYTRSYFGQLPTESHPDSRWRLFGEEFLNEPELRQPGIRRFSVKREEQVSLLADIFRSENEAVNGLVRKLNSLQLSCYNHPENGAMGGKYSKFLEVLALYTTFHRQERYGKSTKRLVWICDAYRACGGLADRIKGATYALILAILSQRALLLSWHDRWFGEQDFLQPNAIEWRVTEGEKRGLYRYDYSYEEEQEKGVEEEYEKGEVEYLHLFSILDGIGVDLPMETLRSSLDRIEGRSQWVVLETNMEPSSLLNDTKTASSEWIKQGMSALGLAKLSPDDVDGLVGLVFRYLFNFKGQLLTELGAARKVLGLNNQQYVGVHVRTGFAGSEKQESVNHPKLFREIWQWEHILTCAHHYATEKLGTSAFLFLATDSYLVKIKTLDHQRYSNKFRALDNTVVHLDKLDNSPHDAEEFEAEGVLSTWIDLILLAESHSLVHGQSGFSFLAQSLCFIPKSKVIDGLQCTPLEIVQT